VKHDTCRASPHPDRPAPRVAPPSDRAKPVLTRSRLWGKMPICLLEEQGRRPMPAAKRRKNLPPQADAFQATDAGIGEARITGYVSERRSMGYLHVLKRWCKGNVFRIPAMRCDTTSDNSRRPRPGDRGIETPDINTAITQSRPHRSDYGRACKQLHVAVHSCTSMPVYAALAASRRR